MRFPALAAATLLCLTALTACSDSDDPEGPDASPSEPTSSSSEPSESTSESTSESPSGPSEEPTEAPSEPNGGTAVPAYWVGQTPMGTRLYREFQRIDGEPLLAAAELVAGGGQPDDPDYRTLWPGVAIESVQPTDGLLLVTLADDGFTTRPDGMSAKAARLAIQQMVHTLQGVQQERVPVQFFRPAGPQQLFGLSTEQPFRQGNPVDLLSLVNITAPAEGERVTGDTLTVSGVANSFEAAGPCRLIRDGEVVVDGSYQAEQWAPDRLFPFTAELPLGDVSGRVTLRCETDDPTGGTEGPGPFVDTKQITVG